MTNYGRKTIRVSIDPLGNTKVEADGFQGVGCAEATKPIEDALAGAGGAERVYKPEWNEHEEQGEQAKLHW